MSEFATNQPWILAVISLLLGAMIGMLLTLLFERRKSGGRSVEEMQHEMDDYKDEVGKHFATTSELFRDMTEKYRDVYNHLASGSQALCEDSMEHTRLELIEAKPLTADASSDNQSQSRDTDQAPVENDTPLKPETAKTGNDKATDPPLSV